MTPNFNFERKLWDRGISYVVGVDEVGRGCFAGPVFAACIGFSSDTSIPAGIRVDDSKRLTHIQRKRANSWIKKTADIVGIGIASVVEIDNIGIVKASFRAMRRAVTDAEENYPLAADCVAIEHLLVDAFDIPNFRGFPKRRQTPIVKGDGLSLSIAAASIVAKVARDNLMEKLSNLRDYRKYKWHKNKGYGTREHRDALLKYGPTRHHRRQFVETFTRNQHTV